MNLEDLARKILYAEIKGNQSYAIYPFGSAGHSVKNVLNYELGILEDYRIDANEKLYHNSTVSVISINKFLKEYDGKTKILLSTINPTIKEDILYNLKSIIPLDQIIDIFPYSANQSKAICFRYPFFSGDPRVNAADAAARQIYYRNVAGDTAEVGVYKGDFSAKIAKFLPDRRLWLFDTFEGFDDRDILNDDRDVDGSFWGENAFLDTSVDYVLDNIGRQYNVEVRKGYFPDTTVGLDDVQFCFVSLDTDLYGPTKSGLEFFWPKLSPGGFIFVHDYDIKTVRQAVYEYCKSNAIGFVHLPDNPQSIVLAKPL